MNLRFHPQYILILIKQRVNHIFQVRLRLKRGASHIFRRVHRLPQFIQCQVERRVFCDQLKQVVVQSLLFHVLSGLHGQLPDTLVKLLTVASCLHGVHHNILRRHERQFRHQPLLDYLRVYYQSVHHIQAQIENPVNRKEPFRYAEPFICRVVQRPLKPLGCRSYRRVQRINHHVSGQRRNPFAAHGIPFIRHSRRPNLGRLEGFLHLFQMLQKPDIVGELMGACRNPCKHIQCSRIHFTGIGLSRYRVTRLKPHLLRNHRIYLVNRLLISLEQLQKARLSTRSPFGSKKFKRPLHIFQIL